MCLNYVFLKAIFRPIYFILNSSITIFIYCVRTTIITHIYRIALCPKLPGRQTLSQSRPVKQVWNTLFLIHGAIKQCWLTVKAGSVTIRVETYGSNRDCVGTILKLRICQVSGLVRFWITQVILYNLFLDNYPAFKGFTCLYVVNPYRSIWKFIIFNKVCSIKIIQNYFFLLMCFCSLMILTA